MEAKQKVFSLARSAIANVVEVKSWGDRELAVAKMFLDANEQERAECRNGCSPLSWI
jgi:hypothetical protein